MSLDIYVGSLARYYAGDWQRRALLVAPASATQQTDKTAEDEVTDPEELRPAVLGWRDQVSEALGDRIESRFDWDESDAAPYFTDKPTWDCYASLLLWAAYSEHPDLAAPRALDGDWTQDPAFQRSADPSYETAFPQLVRDVEIWLPHDVPFVFRAADPTGHELHIGSSVALCGELAALNRRTWNASELDLAAWRREVGAYTAPLEAAARFAFSIVSDLARKAVAHRLVMKLDY